MEMGQNEKGIGRHRIEPYRPKVAKTHYAVALIAVGLVIGVVVFLGLTAFGGLDVVRTWFKLS
jgi:hypothetical protein